MKCDFVYCLYNDLGDCVRIFSGISINSRGLCDNCIMVNIPNKKLEDFKEKTREELYSSRRR